MSGSDPKFTPAQHEAFAAMRESRKRRRRPPRKFTFHLAYRVADVSTGYLAESDLALLLEERAPFHVANMDGNYGSLFTTGITEGTVEDAVATLTTFGFSEKMTRLWRAAHEQGFAYIRFDADGGDVTGAD